MTCSADREQTFLTVAHGEIKMGSKKAVKDSDIAVGIDKLLDLLLGDAHISQHTNILLVCEVLQSLNLVDRHLIASREDDEAVTHHHIFKSTGKLHKLMDDSGLLHDDCGQSRL
jgi:hypothetical protein